MIRFSINRDEEMASVRTIVSKKGKDILDSLKQPAVEKSQSESYGSYERDRAFLCAVAYCLDAYNDKENIQGLIMTLLIRNDVGRLNALLPVSYTEIEKYGRDSEWEKLTASQRKERVDKGELPQGDRYKREIEEFTGWDNTEEQMYKKDLVGVYSSLTKQEVGWTGTFKKQTIGLSTRLAWEHKSARILLHQVLYYGLTFPRVAIMRHIEDKTQHSLIESLLLHCSVGIKPNEWPQILLKAAQGGMITMAYYMLECGTLPDRGGRADLNRHLVLRSIDGYELKEGELESGNDMARNIRISFMRKLTDKEEVKVLSGVHVVAEDS
jgi:hypothetical protein